MGERQRVGLRKCLQALHNHVCRCCVNAGVERPIDVLRHGGPSAGAAARPRPGRARLSPTSCSAPRRPRAPRRPCCDARRAVSYVITQGNDDREQGLGMPTVSLQTQTSDGLFCFCLYVVRWTIGYRCGTFQEEKRSASRPHRPAARPGLCRRGPR